LRVVEDSARESGGRAARLDRTSVVLPGRSRSCGSEGRRIC